MDRLRHKNPTRLFPQLEQGLFRTRAAHRFDPVHDLGRRRRAVVWERELPLVIMVDAAARGRARVAS